MSELKMSDRQLCDQGTNLYLLIQQVPVSIAMFDREMCYLAASDPNVEILTRRALETRAGNRLPRVPARETGTPVPGQGGPPQSMM